MSNKFENKIALITGGTTGIGLATAEKLAGEGAKVVIAGRNRESGEAAERQIRAQGGEATFIQTDVADADQVEILVKQTVALYGGLDFAFNNAGMEALAPIGQMPDDLFARLMDVNVNGIWYSMKHEIAHMMQNGGGVIVNTSSVAGAKGMAGLSAYSASKHAVNGLTKSLALEYAEANIRINGIMPGPIATPMMDRVSELVPGAEEQFVNVTAVKRVGQPQEIADAVAWLFSDESSYVNAAIVPVDGGMIAL
ncbi:MAG: glucose 1-dehydrogenase [Ardenticatenaceae bacterium]|nr:glucose 1-dehydrogenase [Ardenticatenaceae bacterium]